MANNLSINDFVQKFSSGFARSNLFRVNFFNLPELPHSELLSFACKNIQIPGVTFNESKFLVDGYYRKFVSGADYDPITINFFIDGDGFITKLFTQWSAYIFSEGKYGFKESYSCNIDIDLLDRIGNVIHKVKIIEAYPTNISALDLAWENSDTLLEYSISFNFLKLEYENIEVNHSVAAKSPLHHEEDTNKSTFKILKLPFEIPKLPLEIEKWIPEEVSHDPLSITKQIPIPENIKNIPSHINNLIPEDVKHAATEVKKYIPPVLEEKKQSFTKGMIEKAKTFFK